MAIYLDYNATTPVDVEVQDVISSVLKTAWHNPSSSYNLGESAKIIVEDARKKVCKMICCDPDELVFTSGGTESNNMVIHTAIQNFYLERQNDKLPDDEKPHIITTNIEHDSIKLPLLELAAAGKCVVTFIDVSTETGMVPVDNIVEEIQPSTCLITVMLANNETGIIQPVRLLRSRINDLKKREPHKFPHSILLHTDAAQAIGKMEVNLVFCNVDYLTIAGHKFYGPRIGALYFKRNKPLFPFFYGGGQERGYRPGTENTCMIAGLGAAAKLVTSNLERYIDDMESIKGYLQEKLEETFPNRVVFHGKGNVLPNTLSVAFDYDGITGADILKAAPEICASTGAACHSGGHHSSVLIASGVSDILASKTIRLSVGRETTRREIDSAVECLLNALKKVSKEKL